jgi:uncharacterized protein YgiM (DUF1202 family)
LSRKRNGAGLPWVILAIATAALLAPAAGLSANAAADAANSDGANSLASVGPSASAGRTAAGAAFHSDAVSVKLASLVWRHGTSPAPAAADPIVEQTVSVAAPAATAPATPATPPATRLVATAGVNVHVGPAGATAKLFTLSRGETVTLADSRPNWTQVKRDSGQTGWVYSAFLAPAQGN